jgi:hypothetical protein
MYASGITFTGVAVSPSGGGSTVTGADNGTSLKGANVVLGNDLGDVAAPAVLLNNRAIPLGGFGITFSLPGLGTSFFSIDSGAAAMLNYYRGDNGINPAQIITIQGQVPGGNPYGNFWVTLDESYIAPDGQRDAVLQWGYNQNGGGGVVVPNECEVHYTIESHFNAGGSYQNEIHLESTAIDGTKNRIYSFDVNIFNGACEGYFTANGIAFYMSGFSDTGTPYFQMSGTGEFSSFGPAAGMSIINSNAGYGNIVLTTNVDGSVNIQNTGGGGNPTIALLNGIAVSNTDAAFASISMGLINSDGIEGIAFSGVIVGSAFAILAQVSCSVVLAGIMQNEGTGDAVWVSTAAVGNGNAYFLAKNATNADAYSLGLEQVSGNYKLAAGTNLLDPNLYTVTPTGQTGFGGNLTPTAFVHIAASPGTAGLGPLKLTAGPLLAAPEDGLFEYFAGVLYFTVGAVRHVVTLV